MNIFAIIVTYNAMRRSWIGHCLRSLEASSVPVTAIVVDNGSTDGTRSFVPHAFPHAVWLPQERNLGFGQANNIGLRYALEHHGDYILLLNQDATLAADAIENMLPLCSPSTLLSPLHLNGDGTGFDASFRSCLKGSDSLLLDDLLVTKHLKASYPGPSRQSKLVIPAACWFFSADVVRLVGGFNPLFFHYAEDENFMSRAHYHHVEMLFSPRATMCHDRETHGSKEVFLRHHTRRLLLLIATDINNSFGRCLMQWAHTLQTCYFSYLPQKQYTPGAWIAGMFWLLGHAVSIRKSRKKEKLTGPTWL